MFDLGYFLFMEKIEQEQKDLKELRKQELIDDTEQDRENRPFSPPPLHNKPFQE